MVHSPGHCHCLSSTSSTLFAATLVFHHLATTGVPTIVTIPLAGPVTAVIPQAAASSLAPSGIIEGSSPQEVRRAGASKPLRTQRNTVDSDVT